MLRFAAALALISWTLAPHATVAAQSVTITYANAGPFKDSRVVDSWQLRVTGAYVTATDSEGRPRWSVSPSDRVAPDCDGMTQLALDLQDGNGDGRIDATKDEHAWLAITSSWRSGNGWDSAVLLLDISEPAPPRTLWRKDNAMLPEIARLVAEPALATLRIAQAAHRAILIGGGLSTPASNTHASRSGAALLALDIESGRLLWETNSQIFPALIAGVSGAVTALDLDRDGLADRLYVGDAQATVFRFDLDGTAAASALATGGAIARLASTGVPTARSILAAPDVALLSPPDAAPWFNIAVGTAYTGAGTSPVSQGLFVLRDTQPFTHLTQAEFDARPVATPADLQGGHVMNAGTDGIVARALTAAGVLLYTQVEGHALDSCSSPGTLLVKASAVKADTGTPVADAKDGKPITLRVLRRPDGSAPAAFDPPSILPTAAGYRCGIGDLPFEACPPIPRIKRRAWRREDAD